MLNDVGSVNRAVPIASRLVPAQAEGLPRDTFTPTPRVQSMPDPRRMIDPYKMTWSMLEGKLRERGMGEHIGYLMDAYAVAEKAHAGQKRDEGLPYIHHPLRVAYSLLEEQGVRDPALIAAGLLHDTLEDSDLTRDQLKARFGDRAADLVAAVTKPPRQPGQSKKERDDLYFAHLQQAPDDVVRLKLADRLDNVRYLHLGSDEQKKLDYKAQTRTWFLELAGRHDPAIQRQLRDIVG